LQADGYLAPVKLLIRLATIAVSLIFGFYVNNYGNFSKMYGSLAGVIVLIVAVS